MFRKITIFICLVFPLVYLCYAGDECQIYYEYGYQVGYDGGIEEKENGYECNSEEYYGLPLVKAAIGVVKIQIKTEGHYINELEFDSYFKDGFIEGYRDGYYGRLKKKMKHKW